FEFVEGDIGAMPFSDDYADVITGGYALRNVPDLDVALAEIFRVLKPGGIASFLDFMKPVAPWRQRMDQALLHFWGGVVGLAMHGRPWIYQYIPESLAAYPDERTVREKLRAAGFDVTGGRRHFFGMLETIELRKPA
ncbi:MAG: class I SAM-dependent methyltransferase, partial [Verrucomicrobiae bacterium]|nr:class I SAM-dependent methyltransferase [Verrucomicrobiae bacterium]